MAFFCDFSIASEINLSDQPGPSLISIEDVKVLSEDLCDQVRKEISFNIAKSEKSLSPNQLNSINRGNIFSYLVQNSGSPVWHSSLWETFQWQKGALKVMKKEGPASIEQDYLFEDINNDGVPEFVVYLPDYDGIGVGGNSWMVFKNVDIRNEYYFYPENGVAEFSSTRNNIDLTVEGSDRKNNSDFLFSFFRYEDLNYVYLIMDYQGVNDDRKIIVIANLDETYDLKTIWCRFDLISEI